MCELRRTSRFFPGVLLSVLLAVVFGPASATAVINPHYDADSCGSCHLKDPVAGEDGGMDYHFLAEDIDPTCMICHEQNCCTIARPHESTHASGIDRWDEEEYGSPDKLPLSDGYITCATCHFWRRDRNPADEDYKLLRIVQVASAGVDWTALCSDCHKDH